MFVEDQYKYQYQSLEEPRCCYSPVRSYKAYQQEEIEGLEEESERIKKEFSKNSHTAVGRADEYKADDARTRMKIGRLKVWTKSDLQRISLGKGA